MSPDKGAHRAVARRDGGRACRSRSPARCASRRSSEYFDEFVEPHLGDRIEYLGEVSHGEKVELLQNARATLFPIEWEEPFGLVMIESMACGTPVIATRWGAVPEVIEDGRGGIDRRPLPRDGRPRSSEADRARPARVPRATSRSGSRPSGWSATTSPPTRPRSARGSSAARTTGSKPARRMFRYEPLGLPSAGSPVSVTTISQPASAAASDAGGEQCALRALAAVLRHASPRIQVPAALAADEERARAGGLVAVEGDEALPAVPAGKLARARHGRTRAARSRAVRPRRRRRRGRPASTRSSVPSSGGSVTGRLNFVQPCSGASPRATSRSARSAGSASGATVT